MSNPKFSKFSRWTDSTQSPSSSYPPRKSSSRKVRTTLPASNSWLMWLTVPVTIILIGGVFASTIWWQNRNPKVIHFLVDDQSKSAKENEEWEKALEKQGLPTNLRLAHCQVSSNYYKPGDTQIKVDFAARPEQTDEFTFEGVLDLGRCNNLPDPSSEIDKKDGKPFEGTSLILVIEYLKRLIKNIRVKGIENNIVVTLTIDKAEPGKGLPRMDEQGFIALRQFLTDITEDNATVTIIGPTSVLQQQLQDTIGEVPNVIIFGK